MTDVELTDRQREVARMVADGLTSKTIAAVLGISERRVNILITSIAFRISADGTKDDRVQIANWWRKHQAA